ncbi:16S rRNA (cytosine(1402)-N(4))-methyltransferase RsmH [Bythopirellula polymerisocia]|uniref:16S rRNA (cytosine(1402)-N(4))-methyltransferase RsmH n=1 Tax=Bythopirellula polymerisocia TaxID=2528003 RepID=UPI001E45BF84|nr:16S rRNA (cytosine(1402)-N(4))-methyltransferase RsmH [Bythopirellula polymerisocia]
MNPSCHIPVLLDEVIEWLEPSAGRILVDGTLGGGGHTAAFAERVASEGLVLAIDLDPTAINRAEISLTGKPIKLVQANYAEIPTILNQLEIASVDGILLDLGLSSDQLADDQRGFSFQTGGLLDLRFNPDSGENARELLARIGENHLADIIYKYGEERFSRRIARKIVATRHEAPIHTAEQLAGLVRSCVPKSRVAKIDPATRTFQALRIAVNGELDSLESALKSLPDCLKPGGRLAIISFHSLEDRLVKHAFRNDDRLSVLTRRPILASDRESTINPRSRSAKMRVAERA